MPRTDCGALLLCHACQELSVHAGGLLPYLVKRLKSAALSPTEDGCPHCNGTDRRRMDRDAKEVESNRWYCLSCKRIYSGTTGTIFQHRHLPVETIRRMEIRLFEGVSDSDLVREFDITAITAAKWRRKIEAHYGIVLPRSRNIDHLRVRRQIRRRKNGSIAEYFYDPITGKRLSDADAAFRRSEMAKLFPNHHNRLLRDETDDEPANRLQTGPVCTPPRSC